MAQITLENVSKKFTADKTNDGGLLAKLNPFKEESEREPGQKEKAGQFAIKKINLTIPDGQVMVILGPSGCGKSTLLRLIAGLDELDSGAVYYDGTNMIDTPPSQRQIGMVFQDYALYPQKTAQKNILSYFSFKKQTPELDQEAEEKYQRTSELMGVELEHLLGKMPAQLSGGEKQKVAIARCITRDPALFLLDEPFSNLDQKLREQYRLQLKRLLQEFSVTTVYVTHNQEEALALADQVALMNKGQIEQVGPPQTLYREPKNIFVADFLNFDQDTPALNLLSGEVIDSALKGSTVGIRPEDIELNREQGQFKGQVTNLHLLPLKDSVVLSLKLEGAEKPLIFTASRDVSVGDAAWVQIKQYHIFDEASGERLRTEQLA